MPGAKPFTLDAEIPAQLKKVLEKGVRSQLNARYKNASDILQSLESIASTELAYMHDEWLHARANKLRYDPLAFGKKARIGELLSTMPKGVQLIEGNGPKVAREYLDAVLFSENREGKVASRREEFSSKPWFVIRFLMGEDEAAIIYHHNLANFEIKLEEEGLSLYNLNGPHITTVHNRNELRAITNGDTYLAKRGLGKAFRNIQKQLPVTYAALEAMLPEEEYQTDTLGAASHLIDKKKYSKDARPYAIAEKVASVFGARRAKSRFLSSPEYSRHEMRRKLDEAGVHVSVGTLVGSKLVVDRDNFGNVSYFAFEDTHKTVTDSNNTHNKLMAHETRGQYFRLVYKREKE